MGVASSEINSGRNLKRRKLYELLTSPEYNRYVQRKIEGRLKLEGLQTNEVNYHSTMWKKRNEVLREMFELDSKYEAMIRDIIEEEETKDDSDADVPLNFFFNFRIVSKKIPLPCSVSGKNCKLK